MSAAMGTYSPDPQMAERQQRWLANERRARAANATFPIGEDGDFLEYTHEHQSPEELTARQVEATRQIEERRQRLGSTVISPSEVRDAGAAFSSADRSALAAAAYWASQFGSEAQRRFSAAAAFAIARTPVMDDDQPAAAITLAAAPPETVRKTFWEDYQYFHAAVPPNIEWPPDRELRAGGLRHPNDGLSRFTTPSVEPLSSRLERAGRVNHCKEMTYEMLTQLHAKGTCAIYPDIRVKGITVDFLTLTWKGVFLIWSVDHRWTTRQAAMVMPVRAQIQCELGEDWPGQAEAIFHSPRERTGWDRRVMVDDENGQPIDIVIAGGRIDRLLEDWQPIGEVGIDPEWLRWISQAAEPRWWRSEEGRRDLPAPPPHEQL